MKSKSIRLGAGLMSVLLAMSLMAGCGGSKPSPSSNETSSDESTVNTDASGTSIESGSSTGEPGQNPENPGSSNASTSPNSNPGSSNNPGSSTNNPSPKPPSPGAGVNPEDYRGTTVRYATWKDPAQNEDGKVVKDFEKKYGIKVQIDITPQDTYNVDIASKIASGSPPDIYFDNNMFPSSLSVLQPLDAAKLDLTDPIWDQAVLKLSTVGGKPYIVSTLGNIWAENVCVYYNKKLLEDNNITTPEEYYKAGKWTYAALTKVMTDVKNLGMDYIGGYLDFDAMLCSVGTSFYQFKNGTFTNGTSDPMLTNVMQYIATSIKNGLVKGIYYVNRDEFKTGKVGIAITDAFGLKKTGYWQGMNPSHIGFTYLPSWDEKTPAKVTGAFRGWGIVKGAKNPVGAGIFLRYYLDVNNYDTSSAFINSDAENFFFKLTAGDTSNKYCSMLVGATQYLGKDRTDYFEIASGDPAQVSKKISALKNTVESEVAKLNAFLKKQSSLY